MKKISFIVFTILFLNFGIASVYAEEEEDVLSGQELVDGCSEGYLPTNWMNSVPERLNEDAYILATQALHESYPCASANI